MAGVENWHVVLLRHVVDGVEEREEVLLGVDVLLAVGGEEDILALLQAETLVHIARLNLGEVVVEDLRHRRARHVGALLGQAAVGEIAAGVLGVGHVDITDDVDDAAVGLLGQALVLAAVAGLHVEDGDVETLGADDAEAGVGVAKNEDAVGLGLGEEFVGTVDDVAAGGAEVVADGIHVNLRLGELQVAEENAVEIVVVVLAGVGENHVEILAALGDDGGETDYLGAGADDDNELQLAVVLEFYI